MANFNSVITKDALKDLLPVYGEPRVNLPIWDEDQKMFICDQYQSAAGHRYYRGVRFCDNLAVVEKVGLYHNWTYIDEIEVYAFNGEKTELIQKNFYQKKFYNMEFIKNETIKLVSNYLFAGCKQAGGNVDKSYIQKHSAEIVDRSYKSFLDNDYSISLPKVMKLLENK